MANNYFNENGFQIIKTTARFSELSETYLKIQLTEEATLSEDIDEVSRYLSEISRQTDDNKVHENSADVKRAWKALKKCQEKSFLFNERRRLFEILPTQFNERLTSLEHQLEIYKMLWCTASGTQYK